MRERELSDNLMVYEKQDEIHTLRGKILKQEEKLGGLDVNNLQFERKEKEDKYERYLKEVPCTNPDYRIMAQSTKML
jgi:cell division protein FtsL